MTRRTLTRRTNVLFSALLSVSAFAACSPRAGAEPPLESTPAKAKPAKAKRAESKSVESKSAESKSAESKSAEKMPAESKSGESKSGESKPAGLRPEEATRAAAAQQTPKLGEAWYDVKLSGKKLGFAQSVDERTKVNGRDAYHLHRWERLTIKRLGPTLRIEATTDGWVGLDGTPMRFKHDRMEGSEQRGVEGYRDGDMLVIRRKVGANVVQDRVPIKDDLRLASSIELILAQRLKVGFRMKGRAVDETQGDIVPYSIEVVGKDASGRFEVKQQLGPIKATMWMTADGTVERSILPELGIEQVKVTKREAMLPSEVIDLFSQALLRLPRPLPSRNDIQQLVVRIESKGGNTVEAVGDDRQTVRQDGRAAELTIRVQKAPTKKVVRPIKDQRWQAFLRSTEYEPLDHSELRATAAKLTADEPSVWGAARAINGFVYRHIKDKTLARAYMSAPEALASEEGDCTEHSVLFSSLAKIAGIPTRLVTGLVYVGGPENVLGYHEWVEIWTGEEWLAMDPTFGQDVADATHIKLHAGLSDPKGLRASGHAAGRALADFDFKVVAYVDASGKRHPL